MGESLLRHSLQKNIISGLRLLTFSMSISNLEKITAQMLILTEWRTILKQEKIKYIIYMIPFSFNLKTFLIHFNNCIKDYLNTERF